MGLDTRDDEHKVIRAANCCGLSVDLVTLGVVVLLKRIKKSCMVLLDMGNCPPASYLAEECIKNERGVSYQGRNRG
jgi:hypothetical protein